MEWGAGSWCVLPGGYPCVAEEPGSEGWKVWFGAEGVNEGGGMLFRAVSILPLVRCTQGGFLTL